LLLEDNVDAVVVTAVDLAGSPEQVLLRQRKLPFNSGPATLSFDKNTNGWLIGEGAGTVILKSIESAKKDDEQIFATVDSIAFSSGLTPESVENAANQALTEANVSAGEIGMLEVFGSGSIVEDSAEMRGLAQAYAKVDAGCALGSIKSNVGHTFAASGMASLIKAALCLHHRFIPGVPEWKSPKTELQSAKQFYVPVESRPWLIQSGIKQRHAAVSSLGIDNICSHLILSEASPELRQTIKVAESGDLNLFLVTGQEKSAISKGLLELEKDLLQTIMKKNMRQY
jgi:acyl transferase domain-containing protein